MYISRSKGIVYPDTIMLGSSSCRCRTAMLFFLLWISFTFRMQKEPEGKQRNSSAFFWYARKCLRTVELLWRWPLQMAVVRHKLTFFVGCPTCSFGLFLFGHIYKMIQGSEPFMGKCFPHKTSLLLHLICSSIFKCNCSDTAELHGVKFEWLQFACTWWPCCFIVYLPLWYDL